MLEHSHYFGFISMLGLAAFMTCKVMAQQPPAAKKVPHKLENPGGVRIDDYYWLKERNNPEVLEYLKAENAYTEAVLKHTEPLKEKLFGEIKARIKEDDSSVPFKYGNYYYYKRYEQGFEYPIYARKKGSLEAPEEIILNANELGKGKPYFQVEFPSIRPDHKMIAFAVDTGGRRFYNIYFKDLETGRVYDEYISSTSGNMAWANDNKTLFYVKQNPETLRWERMLKHTLGGKEDAEIYFEKDETFEIGISKSGTDRYVFMRAGATLSTEYRYLSADAPDDGLKIFYPRQEKLEYDVEDGGDIFYVLNNGDAKNFKVSTCPKDETGREKWRDVLAHRDLVLVESLEVFKNWLVVKEREDGLPRLRVINRSANDAHLVKFDEAAYVTGFGENFEYDTDWLRFTYDSLTTPSSVYDYNMTSRERKLMKRQVVLGGFKPEDYISERVRVTARDGEKVPMSLVYKKGFKKDGTHPVYIYSYGSYGYSAEADFSSIRLSLLDRGFVYAIPHIRGGSEMGRRWYEDGRQLKKKNTFYDFIDATKYLVEQKYAEAGHVYAEGGSAGGLLMGAVLNMAPELYRGVLAEVPFVDVVTTMLDPDVPLTTSEYDEWGNPNSKEFYDYMLSYSPYDNVEAKAYPNILITAGLNDSQVQYWEPAKWAARLRAMKTDKNILLLRTDLEAGHGGKSGRFESLKLIALESAFFLDLEGIKE